MGERTNKRNKPLACCTVGEPCCLSMEMLGDYAKLLTALADPTRLGIINMLANNTAPVCVCDITAQFNKGQPTISHHLGILREAGLVHGTREGIWAYYSLNRERLGELQGVLATVYQRGAPLPLMAKPTGLTDKRRISTDAPPIRVLFLCTHNQARSQIAEGLLRKIGGERFAVYSAGSEPAEEIHPLAQQLLREQGIDPTMQQPKSMDIYTDQPFDCIITTCEEDLCPRVLGEPEQLHWNLPDPAATKGTSAAQLREFRRIFSEIEQRVREFARSHKSARQLASISN